jgi:hypothetical protein
MPSDSGVSTQRKKAFFNIKHMNWKSLFQSKAATRLEQFQQIMQLAKEIAGTDPRALLDLIKLLLRPLQASLMVRVTDGSRTATSDIQKCNFFMGAKYASIFKESQALPPDKFKVRLTSDIILP